MLIEILHSDKSMLKIALSGKLDATNVAHGAAKFYTLLNGRKSPVVLDFSEVTYLSSLGVRMLLTASKDLTKHGHRLIIEKPTAEVHKVLHTAGLDGLLK